MKGWITALALALLLTGCGEKKPDPMETAVQWFGSSGSFTGVIASEELAEEVSLSVQWEGDQMQLDFTAPEDLDGLNVTFQGTSVEVRYREMKLPLLAEEIPEQSVRSALRDTLLEGGQRLTDARWDGQRLLAEGTVGLEPVELCWEGEPLQLRAIAFPAGGTVVTVTGQ